MNELKYFVVEHDADEEIVDIYLYHTLEAALAAADLLESRAFRCDVIEGRMLDRAPMEDA